MSEEMLLERPVVHTNGKAVRPSVLGERYHALIERIRAANIDAEFTQSIGIVGCERGVGTSTVAFNLAVATARAECGPVLFIDADLSKSFDWQLIAESPDVGLSDVLADGAEPLDCVVGLSIKNLSAVAGKGKASLKPADFDPRRIVESFNEFERHFKAIIVAIPAPNEHNGSIYLASQMDAVVLIIDAERQDARIAARTKQQLADANVNLLGAILNKHRPHGPEASL